MRTTPYGRTPSSRSSLAIRQALRTAVRKFSRCLVAHRRAVEPDRRRHRADDETLGGDLGGEGFQVVVADVDIGVWVVKEKVDAVELDARRPRPRPSGSSMVSRSMNGSAPSAPLADQAGPHRIVQFRIIVAAHRVVLELVVSGRGEIRDFVSVNYCGSQTSVTRVARWATDCFAGSARPGAPRERAGCHAGASRRQTRHSEKRARFRRARSPSLRASRCEPRCGLRRGGTS